MKKKRELSFEEEDRLEEKKKVNAASFLELYAFIILIIFLSHFREYDVFHAKNVAFQIIKIAILIIELGILIHFIYCVIVHTNYTGNLRRKNEQLSERLKEANEEVRKLKEDIKNLKVEAVTEKMGEKK